MKGFPVTGEASRLPKRTSSTSKIKFLYFLFFCSFFAFQCPESGSTDPIESASVPDPKN
jgi:hypothetical protein